MLSLILQVIYFMLPAYMANMAPVFAKKINFLNFPVDFNKKLGGKPIFGSHKTYRGFFFGVLSAIIIAYAQKLLYSFAFFSSISLLDYSNWLVLGFLLGFGALFGDLAKSFFKRRAGVKPGKSFMPWDQIDYTVGALVFAYFIIAQSWQFILTALALNFILHVLANHISYYLGLSKVKW